MDFKIVYSEPRKLFVTGYNVTDDKFDPYHFDMLASESRLASFAAVCKGDVADDHWYMLSRHFTCAGGHGQALISWTASMFEYLMPLIVMRPYQDTALRATYGTVVARQIEYGKVHGVPWGISEAGYNARDQHMAYLYGPFGVPGLGLKRGLSTDLVISPYSTMLAAMVDPASALTNLEALQSLDAFGRYGFYESIDYTSKRLVEGEACAVIQSYMVHHQGMGLSSLSNALNAGVMQSRFHTHPLVQATQTLLLERVPSDAVFSLPRADEVHLETICSFSSQPTVCVPGQHPSCSPRSQLESTGNDRVLVTSCGPGCSKCTAFAKGNTRAPDEGG
jgi:cyclic beta-1,2-glucan synthetase